MTLLVLNRGPLSRREYHRWLADYPGDLVLLASQRSLQDAGEQLPQPGAVWAHTEAVADYEDPARLHARALALAADRPLHHLVACQERDLVVAGRLRDDLGLPGQTERSALAFRDKLVMKEIAAAAGIAVAAHAAIESADQLRDFVAGHGFPVVVKPRDSAGSSGLRTITSPHQLDAFLADPVAVHAATGGLGMLAEAFVDGPMFHVDGLLLDGRVVAAWPSRYHYRLADFQDEQGPRYDIALDPADPLTLRLLSAADRVLAALPSPPSTTFHAEFFHRDDGALVLCEIASRSGGALIRTMLHAMFGVDLTETWVRAVAGLPTAVAPGTARLQPQCIAGEVTFVRRPGLHVPDRPRPDHTWLAAYQISSSGTGDGVAVSSSDIAFGCVATGADAAVVLDRLQLMAAYVQERRPDPASAVVGGGSR